MPASQVPKGFGGCQGLTASPAPWGKPGLGHPRNQGWVGAGLELLYNRADPPPCARISVAGGSAGMSREGGSGTRSGPSGSGGTRAAGEGTAPV